LVLFERLDDFATVIGWDEIQRKLGKFDTNL